jgi:hypothetical protein
VECKKGLSPTADTRTRFVANYEWAVIPIEE